MRSPILPLLFLLATGSAIAQQDDDILNETPVVVNEKWYDTLTVTEPRYAQVTPLEGMALSAFLAVSVPSLLAIAGVSALPPSVVVRREDGIDRAGVSISGGAGIGGDRSTLLWFPDARVQGEAAYFFDRERPLLLNLSLLLDHRFGTIDRREIFWAGIAGGAGVSTDFAGVSPYVEGFVGLSNPLGISYTPFRPAHHYGLRFRTGYDLVDKRIWHEAAFAITSTFFW